METDQANAVTALNQDAEGQPVTDAWYRHALKSHRAGEHKSRAVLCPACAA